MPMNPAFPSLHDLQPRGSGWGDLLGITKNPGFSLARRDDLPVLQQVEQGIMTGVYGDDDIKAFAKNNPQAAPLLQQAVQKRNIFQRNFQPGVQASPELAPMVGGLYAGQEATGQQGPVSRDAEQLAQFGREEVNNVPGAVNELNRAGQVDLAKKLLDTQGQPQGDRNWAIKMAMRAANVPPHKTPETMTPEEAQRTYGFYSPATSAPVPGGTAILPRGGAPRFIPNPRDLPEKVLEGLSSKSADLYMFKNLRSSFKPAYSGYGSSIVGSLRTSADQSLPAGVFGADTNRADWWKTYQSHKNKVRSSLFGAALTDVERVEFEKADINPGMQPEIIEMNLKRQDDIARRAAIKIIRSHESSGRFDRGQIVEAVGGVDAYREIIGAKRNTSGRGDPDKPASAQKPDGMSDANWNELQRLRQKQSGR